MSGLQLQPRRDGRGRHLCEVDECGVCRGDGIADGDCDCDGNQLDALGVCGGTCPADLDGDGVCDTTPSSGVPTGGLQL